MQRGQFLSFPLRTDCLALPVSVKMNGKKLGIFQIAFLFTVAPSTEYKVVLQTPLANSRESYFETSKITIVLIPFLVMFPSQ